MLDDILNISEAPIFDDRITKVELHTYNPYANTMLGNNDEIRIPIQQQDLYVLPCRSFLYVEGTLNCEASATATSNDQVLLDNNCVAFMFDEIRYELNGVEIDRARNPGITTTLKNYTSLSKSRSEALSNARWVYNIEEESDVYTITKDAPSLNFNFCVPLNMLLGFCEDFKRVVINARHELILIRARVDSNAVHRVLDNLKPSISLHKIQWRVPHIALEETHKLKMLRILDSGRSLDMSFRSWDLYEYPLLQTTTKHTWPIKTVPQLEKPRYVIFAMQTDGKNNLGKKASEFDHCALSNVRLYLNSEMYPYDDLNIDFNRSKYALLYDMYMKFRESYYGYGEPLLNTTEFLRYGPFVVIDCSRQNETLKSATVDIRIEFECRENVPPATTAYCLMIHDRIVEYNPLTNIVRKIT